ncbi:MAG: DUF1018 domain-containing protein [Deltaproteobacteria bacterium]|nr:DUF1018 domain-containing protein [Deltaproteobacteria bacterium]
MFVPSTKKQRQLIGIACGQLGIDKDLKEDMLMERYGKAHTTEISRAQAAEFLDELHSRGFKVRPRLRPVATARQGTKGSGRRLKSCKEKGKAIPRTGGKVVRLASLDQIDKIRALAGLVRWKYADGLDRWMKKRLNVEKVRTAYDAWLVIEGLKKLFENQMKKKYGPKWRELDWSARREIEFYLEEHGG